MSSAVRILPWSFVPARLLALAISLIVGFVAISNQSFWIDEANSAVLAIQPGFTDFLSAFSQNRGSDLQMPGYMLLLWMWEKIVGPDEWGLRSLNIGFFLIAQCSLLFVLRAKLGVSLWSAGLALLYPFVWYYLDEARPYLMQFAAGTMCAVGLVNLRVFPQKASLSKDVAFTLAGLVLLCASSLIGVLLASAIFAIFALTVLTSPVKEWVIAKRGETTILFIGAGLLLGVMAVFYVWTLTLGARASGVAQTTPLTIGFAIYEILGFAGLGPDRNQLRGTGLSALTPFFPTLSLGVVGMLTLALGMLALLRSVRPAEFRAVIPILVAGLLLTAVLVAAGYFAGFRVLGRHLTPFTPFLILAMAVTVNFLCQRRGTRWMAILILLPWLVSDWGLRFSGTFQKDAYREASAIALQAAASNKSVWWAADPAALQFYASTAEGNLPSSTIVLLASPGKSDLQNQPRPDLIILSKPDIYDAQGAIREMLVHFPGASLQLLPAFEIVSVTHASRLPTKD